MLSWSMLSSGSCLVDDGHPRDATLERTSSDMYHHLLGRGSDLELVANALGALNIAFVWLMAGFIFLLELCW